MGSFMVREKGKPKNSSILSSTSQPKLPMSIPSIEHSMKVISDICDKVFVLNFGRKMAEGTPEEIQQNEQVLKAYLGGA